MKVLLVLALAVLPAVSAFSSPWQPFTALGESPDGRSLATGGFRGEVLWWEVSTGEVLRKWQLDGLPVAAVRFDAEGGTLAAVQSDGQAVLLSPAAAEGKPLVLSGPSWTGLAASARRWKESGSTMSGTQAVFGALLAKGFADGSIVVSGFSDLGEVSWTAHVSSVTGLAWSPDGGVLTSCSFDGSLAQWDPRTGKLLSRL